MLANDLQLVGLYLHHVDTVTEITIHILYSMMKQNVIYIDTLQAICSQDGSTTQTARIE